MSLKLSDTRVYAPQTRARLGTTGVVVLKLRAVAGVVHAPLHVPGHVRDIPAAQGTPTQCHISRSILVYAEKDAPRLAGVVHAPLHVPGQVRDIPPRGACPHRGKEGPPSSRHRKVRTLMGVTRSYWSSIRCRMVSIPADPGDSAHCAVRECLPLLTGECPRHTWDYEGSPSSRHRKVRALMGVTRSSWSSIRCRMVPVPADSPEILHTVR